MKSSPRKDCKQVQHEAALTSGLASMKGSPRKDCKRGHFGRSLRELLPQ